MYNSQDEKRLYEQAKHLLQDYKDTNATILKLREVIIYADWKYYVQNNPVLSDSEYDNLFKKIKIS